MRRVSANAVVDALAAIDLGSGDAVLVHSSLVRFGRPEDGVDTYHQAFERILGSTGTLAVPTFSFGFLSSGVYHWSETASEGMGAFSEHIRKHPDAQRARHPLQSVSVIGPQATTVAGIEAASAYSKNGLFQAMCDLDFKVVLLGADPVHISHSHLAEERCRVPYRFDMAITGRTLLAPGEDWMEREWSFFARDLELDVRPEGEERVVAELIAQGRWSVAHLNGVEVFAGSAREFVDNLSTKLKENAWWMAPSGKPDNDKAASASAELPRD